MRFAGRFILGDTVLLSCLCRDAENVPMKPDRAPVAVVTGDSALTLTMKLPIRDRFTLPGYFAYPLVLDSRFAVGHYTVGYQWVIAGTPYGSTGCFEVTGGGQADGPGLAMFFLHRPQSDWVLLQTDGGRMIRRRNPRIA